jgi:hypothetical protein
MWMVGCYGRWDIAARNDILVIVATGGDVHGPDLQIGLGGDDLKMLERFAPRFEDVPVPDWVEIAVLILDSVDDPLAVWERRGWNLGGTHDRVLVTS